MLGLLLIYFIGKKFYDLAENYNKNKWLYAIGSVICYYVSGIVILGAFVLLDIFLFEWGVNWEDNYGINLLSIPIGLLSVYILYQFLEGKWKKTQLIPIDEINEIGKDIS